MLVQDAFPRPRGRGGSIMGVSGLLKLVEEAAQVVHMRDYKGKRVGIDASTWLHKGAPRRNLSGLSFSDRLLVQSCDVT